MLAVADQRTPWRTWWMDLASVLGSGAIEVPVALGLTVSLFLRGWPVRARWYLVAVLSGWALYGLAKLAVQRPRPQVVPYLVHSAGWYSYPSGHSMLTPLVFGLGVLVAIQAAHSPLARGSLVGLAALLSGAVALSRVYLGVHYPSDVLGGLLLGTAWSLLWLHWGQGRLSPPR